MAATTATSNSLLETSCRTGTWYCVRWYGESTKMPGLHTNIICRASRSCSYCTVAGGGASLSHLFIVAMMDDDDDDDSFRGLSPFLISSHAVSPFAPLPTKLATRPSPEIDRIGREEIIRT